MLKKCVSAHLFVLGLSVAAPAFADVIIFDPDGGGALAPREIASLDWLSGAVSITGHPGVPLVGDTFQTYFQGNLGTSVGTNGLPNYTNNSGAPGTLDSFTLVVG